MIETVSGFDVWAAATPALFRIKVRLWYANGRTWRAKPAEKPK